MLTSVSTFVRRMMARLRRDRLDDELREEIEMHLELRRRQLIEDGMDPIRAGQEAQRTFGNVVLVREHAREMWSVSAVDVLVQDVRYGLRVTAKSPLFSAVAVVSLAVGIGAATVLFSFANTWLFRPLPVADPAAIVQVFTTSFDDGSRGGSSYPDFEDMRRTGVFRGLAASMHVKATLTDANRADVFGGLLVSPDYFDVLGLTPSRGRFFDAGDERRADGDPTIVLSHDTWQRRFAGDPDVVGRTIRINGRPFTLIGVGPPRFAGTSFDHSAEFFVTATSYTALMPAAGDVTRLRRARAFTLFGRLDESVSVQAAGAALQVLATQLFRQYPVDWADGTGRGRSIVVMPELAARTSTGEAVVILGAIIAGVVLLVGIACVNVATVLLARASARRKEIAVRLALGASRVRVVCQLLTECGLLGVAGGTLGILIAQWCALLFSRFRPDEAPAFNLTVDYRVALFAGVVSVLAVLFFGLAPALQTTRADVNDELKDREPVYRGRRIRAGLRDALVVVQIAASLVLVLGAALMARSLRAVETEDLGFRRDGIVNVGIDLSPVGERDVSVAFVPALLNAAAAVPGVEAAALASLVPLDGSNRTLDVEVRHGGNTIADSIDGNTITAGYFRLLDLPLLHGREFTDLDTATSPYVAVVNETMARQFWGSNALGASFREPHSGRTVDVIGIVRDFRHRSFAEPPRPMAWFPASQRGMDRMTLHLRTHEPASAIGPALRDRIRAIQPAAGVTGPLTMSGYVEKITVPQRITGGAAAALGILELLLAAMALYGVIAFTVTRRTREIGIRVALGASAPSVARLIVRDGIVLALAGILLGTIASLAAAPAFASLLIGVGPIDPIGTAGAAILILVVAAVASYVPARRALRVDPSVALRSS